MQLIFLAYFASNKKMERVSFFDQNHGVTPLEKSQFFDFFTCFFFYNQNRRFFLLAYRATHFLGLFCLIKKMEKVAIFDQNHGLTPFENSTCLDFIHCPFYSLKRGFFFLEYHKTHSRGLFCPKEKDGKISNFYSTLYTNLPSRISCNSFSWPLLPEIKKWKKF